MQRREIGYRAALEDYEYLKRRYQMGGFTLTEYEERLESQDIIRKLDSEREEMQKGFETEKVFMIWSASKKIIKPEWIFPLKEYSFEGMKVTSIHDYDLYLREHYGDDYEVFPPDADRRVGIERIEIERV